jgi:VWFA-related protein
MRDPIRFLGLVAVSAFFAGAQSDEVRVSAHTYVPPQLRLTAQTQLVQMDVIVRDARGRVVSGLKQGDFEILDEGKPREIAAFAVETRPPSTPTPPPPPAPDSPSSSAPTPTAIPQPIAPPRSTLLFFDDLHTSTAEMQRTQIAARRFIKDGLGLGGRAGVFASSQGLLLDFTADTGALMVAIEKLRPHQRVSENGLQPCPRITPYQAYLIEYNDLDALNAAVQEYQQCINAAPTVPTTGRPPRLNSVANVSPTVMAVRAQASATWQQAHTDSQAAFDAVDNALALLAKAPGARVLLMVSTGFLSGRMDSDRTEAIDRAIRSGIVINALDAKGLWSESPGRESQTTGSLPLATFFFETSTIGTRNDAMNQAMEEFTAGTGGLFFHNNNDLVEGFSQLGAVPETTYAIAFKPDSDAPAGQYHKLKVRLTARNGDYVQARPGYLTLPPPAEPKIDIRPIDQQATGSDVLTQIPVTFAERLSKTDKGPLLSLTIHVDLASLKFTERDDRHLQKLTFIGAVLDPSGKLVSAKEGEMNLALKQETLDRLKASGVNASLSLSAPPGGYKVRVVVVDAEGKLASATQSVEIPQ